jgi:phage baseplate assembly protein W
MPPPVIPKLQVPIQMGTKGLRTVEQNSADELAACIYALAATERGSRLEEPDYGVEDPTFDQIPREDAFDELRAQAAIYEPRAQISSVEALTGTLAKIGVGVES